MASTPLVRHDPRAMRFEINRAALVEPAVLERERSRIFDRGWIYVGHDSEVRQPGDFKTRIVCGRPVILCRDSGGALRVFLNTCRHRGAMVCREREGNAPRYTCFYHGWTYDRDGRLYAVPGQSAYPPSFDKGEYSLGQPPKVDAYGGFVFLSFDRDAEPLEQYLGAAKEYLDLVLDQSPSRRLEVIHGTQEY